MFKMKEIFKQAISSAMEVLNAINYDGGRIDEKAIVKYAENKTNNEIKVYTANFKPLGETFEQCGAFTMVKSEPSDGKKGKVDIYLNSKYSLEHNRFSLVHELGHLITGKNNFEKGRAIASTHMLFDLTYLSEDCCVGNTFLENEQVANVFALEVLLPKKELLKYGSNDGRWLGAIMGVTPDAVKSRFELESAID